MPVQCTCPTCGTAFTRKPSKVQTTNFCSVRCSRTRPHDPPVVDDAHGVARIPLHDHFGRVRACAVIDATDAAWASQWPWHLTGKGYVGRIAAKNEERPGSVILLHRELLGLPRLRQGHDCDHINRDKLDCRRANLRAVPTPGNAQNQSARSNATSRFRGVGWHKATGKWAARATVDGRDKHLGLFASEEEAAAVARSARLAAQPFATD